MPLIREWFSAAEIAAATLTGMPTSARGVLDVAQREEWLRPVDEGATWRKRQKRGGGVEFHISVLPPTARVQMQTLFGRRGLQQAMRFHPVRALLDELQGFLGELREAATAAGWRLPSSRMLERRMETVMELRAPTKRRKGPRAPDAARPTRCGDQCH